MRVLVIEFLNAPEGGLVALGAAVQGAMRVGRTIGRQKRKPWPSSQRRRPSSTTVLWNALRGGAVTGA